MTVDKLQLWLKDKAFQFWNKNAEKSVWWIEIDAQKEMFTYLVYKKYPGVGNEKNKVIEECNMCHKNYLTQHKKW